MNDQICVTNLIVRNLQVSDDVKTKLTELLSFRPLRIYWGVSPIEPINIGYFFPLLKIADFLRCNCEVIILIADLHAYLDNRKTSLDLIEYRSRYYEEMFKMMLESISVSTENLRFIRGMEFQLQREYTFDMYKLATLVTDEQSRLAVSTIMPGFSNNQLGCMLYPVLQALDEEYLNVDVQFGAENQEHVFKFAEKYLPMIDYQPRIHLTGVFIPSLNAINILDDESSVRSKINLVDDMNLLLFSRLVLFESQNGSLYTDKYPKTLEYHRYEDLERDYLSGKVGSIELRQCVTFGLNSLIEPMRRKFRMGELDNLINDAFPDIL